MNTTHKTPTLAEIAAAEMGDDGQSSTAPDGRTLAEVCGVGNERIGACIRYDFGDGSSIIEADDGSWDLGITGSTCACWASIGHTDDCADAQDDDVEDAIEECAYCGRESAPLPEVPHADDDAAWRELAPQHAATCEWIATRAHRR